MRKLLKISKNDTLDFKKRYANIWKHYILSCPKATILRRSRFHTKSHITHGEPVNEPFTWTLY